MHPAEAVARPAIGAAAAALPADVRQVPAPALPDHPTVGGNGFDQLRGLGRLPGEPRTQGAVVGPAAPKPRAKPAGDAQSDSRFSQPVTFQPEERTMYDPTQGRWLAEDPIAFNAGDANLYRYVGNSPTDFTDPTGQQKMTDKEYEKDGIADAIDKETLKKIKGMMGKPLDYPGKYKGQEYKVHFKFEKAYKGTYKDTAKTLDTVGMYVKIAMSVEGKIRDSLTELRVIQIAARITKKAGAKEDDKDKYQIDKPNLEIRQKRAGWDDKKAPSRGWYVDKGQFALDPFYFPHSKTGKSNETIYSWDSPGFLQDGNPRGDEGRWYYTCLLGKTKDGWLPLGCVQWGFFYTDKTKTIEAFKPEAKAVPAMLYDAVDRINKLSNLEESRFTKLIKVK
jgi:RHS repeat-associated protein